MSFMIQPHWPVCGSCAPALRANLGYFIESKPPNPYHSGANRFILIEHKLGTWGLCMLSDTIVEGLKYLVIFDFEDEFNRWLSWIRLWCLTPMHLVYLQQNSKCRIWAAKTKTVSAFSLDLLVLLSPSFSVVQFRWFGNNERKKWL